MPVWRPRWQRGGGCLVVAGMKTLVDRFFPGVGANAQNNTLKHAFLTDRWPSGLVPLCAEVASVLAGPRFSEVIPPTPAGWTAVMTVSGWDNSINRMMTKYCGNVKVHAMKNLAVSAAEYVKAAPLEGPDARWLLAEAVSRPLRPLVASEGDWAMVMDIRQILMGENSQKAVVDEEGRPQPTWFVYGHASTKLVFTPDIFLLHLFLTRYGAFDRSYLPVGKRSRKYAYIDAKVAQYLLRSPRKKKAGKSANADDVGEEAIGSASASVGEMLGLTPELFNRRKKQLRASIRRQKAAAYRRVSSAESATRRGRLKKDRDRWRKTGASSMPKGSRVDSVETDGVGLRMVVKRKVPMAHLIVAVPVPDDRGAPSSSAAASAPRVRRTKKKVVLPAAAVCECCGVDSQPIVVGMDKGCAKLYSAAISDTASKKPASLAFTRPRYYFEMGHSARRRWELAVMAASAPLKHAVDRLSLGSTGTCDPETWHVYLVEESARRGMLDAEFVENVERAKWTMQLHRAKRRSLDAAARRLVTATTFAENGKRHPLERTLVLGIGDADFAPGGHGQLSAPTSELDKALKRALDAVRATGRRVVELPVDEFKTTKCCCACGVDTSSPIVRRRWKDRKTGETIIKDGPSRRLRCCTTCVHTGKNRDRDVQGARNILWLTFALYYGLPRPEYMRREGPGDG